MASRMDAIDERDFGDEELVGVQIGAIIPIDAVETQRQSCQEDDEERYGPGVEPRWTNAPADCHHARDSRQARVLGRTRLRLVRGVLRIVFFGSPEFAVPTLQSLATSPAFDVALVVTQAAKGRRRSKWPRTDSVCLSTSRRRCAIRVTRALTAAEPDLFVVAAFGLIFRERTLDIPRQGSINIHPSLLPKYRGASPIVAAITAGDHETGVALMVMDAGIDTGAVISQERALVADDDTSESLGGRLARIGAELAVRDIPRWVEGT